MVSPTEQTEQTEQRLTEQVRQIRPLPVNPNPPTVLHCDLNAAFARTEQQAWTLWRGKPLGVVPFVSPGSAVISPSYELKKEGAKTAMRVRDVRLLAPSVILKQSDPALYREVQRRFCRIFRDYSPDVVPKSIDEAIIFLDRTPALRHRTMEDIGLEIKERVRREIGPWMSVNVGIGTNAFLAKTAAGLHKPDGLDRLDNTNVKDVFSTLSLTDLCGINTRYEARLNMAGIFTPLQFLDAEAGFLCRNVFQSIEGFYWYRKLRGYEAEVFVHDRKTFGNSVQLSHGISKETLLLGIVNKLCHKASLRMRRDGFSCRTVQLSLRYQDNTHFRERLTLDRAVSSVGQVFKAATLLFNQQKAGGEWGRQKPVVKVMVDLYNLDAGARQQLELFEDGDVAKDRRLTEAMDAVNYKYGMYALTSALLVGLDEYVLDRISFGSVQDLEELYSEQEALTFSVPEAWEE